VPESFFFSESFCVGACTVCGVGLLEILMDMKHWKCLVVCDECFAEYKNPIHALNRIEGTRTSVSSICEIRVRLASLEEIQEAGWEKYIDSSV